MTDNTKCLVKDIISLTREGGILRTLFCATDFAKRKYTLLWLHGCREGLLLLWLENLSFKLFTQKVPICYFQV